MMEPLAVERHFCRVQDRWLHYRRLGQGPAVLLFHQTPQSSQTMEPLMRLLARHCTAIAVDTPGFGQSDALPEKVWSMAALSDLMLAFMNQLGLETVGVCGQHTARPWPQSWRVATPLVCSPWRSTVFPCSTRKNVKQLCRINCTASCRRQMGAT